MNESLEKIALFMDKIKDITIWDRILPWKWRKLKELSYEAYSEYKRMIEKISRNAIELENGRTNIATLQKENEQIKLNNTRMEKEIEQLKSKSDNEGRELTELKETISAREEAIRQSDKDITTKKNEILRLSEKDERLTQENSQIKEELAIIKESEASVLKQYENKMATLDSIQKRIEDERKKEQEARHEEEIKKITSMKENWSRHEEKVKEVIRGICQRHVIEYVDKPPFKGRPDNTIKICDEYIIFDAKSPGTEDLSVFNKYIRAQAEGVKKYVREENVRREIFLVVPIDSINAIEKTTHNMGDYTVYVVTLDALEPLILSLRKIEDYEFAEELTPEERDNICRLIGKFSHTAKRRIQIDHFFARQFIDVLTKCEIDVPSDMRQKIIEFEKAEIINPTIDKRTRQITTRELLDETGKVKREAEAKDLIFPDSTREGIKALPLYSEDENENSRE